MILTMFGEKLDENLVKFKEMAGRFAAFACLWHISDGKQG